MENAKSPLAGRGAQTNPRNPFRQHHFDVADERYMDEPALATAPLTQFLLESPKTVLNRVTSPDLPMTYSLNPYQGCEHGCVYCYARNSHEYWGFSAGLDFERKIMVKPNAPQLLEEALRHPKWQPQPLMLSGNTDCYQPAERQYQITQQLLQVLLKHRHPVGLITKNALILRDLDILTELAAQNLVHVYISITTLQEDLRRALEPRTATAARRLGVIGQLAQAGVPVGVMAAPMIPALNSDELPAIIEQAAQAGAQAAGYTLVRLNGAVGPIFEDWLWRTFPDRANKVLRQIKACHGGQLNDSQFGRRMRGEGPIADLIAQMFALAKRRHLAGRAMPEYNLTAFAQRPGQQLPLF
jgi:DNA repair photolyase